MTITDLNGYPAGLNFDGEAGARYDSNGGIYQGGEKIGTWQVGDPPPYTVYPACTCGPWWGINQPPPCPYHRLNWFKEPVVVIHPPSITTTGTATTPATPPRIPDYVPED